MNFLGVSTCLTEGRQRTDKSKSNYVAPNHKITQTVENLIIAKTQKTENF